MGGHSRRQVPATTLMITASTSQQIGSLSAVCLRPACRCAGAPANLCRFSGQLAGSGDAAAGSAWASQSEPKGPRGYRSGRGRPAYAGGHDEAYSGTRIWRRCWRWVARVPRTAAATPAAWAAARAAAAPAAARRQQLRAAAAAAPVPGDPGGATRDPAAATRALAARAPGAVAPAGRRAAAPGAAGRAGPARAAPGAAGRAARGGSPPSACNTRTATPYSGPLLGRCNPMSCTDGKCGQSVGKGGFLTLDDFEGLPSATAPIGINWPARDVRTGASIQLAAPTTNGKLEVAATDTAGGAPGSKQALHYSGGTGVYGAAAGAAHGIELLRRFAPTRASASGSRATRARATPRSSSACTRRSASRWRAAAPAPWTATTTSPRWWTSRPAGPGSS